MIASRQPNEINEIVERYNNDIKQTEASYLDLVIKSGGLLSYNEILAMPVNTLSLFVERFNAHTEDQNQQMKAAQQKGRR